LEYLSIIWEWLDQQFKPVIVLSASIFTVFFALKKIGNKVNVTYTVTITCPYPAVTSISKVEVTVKDRKSVV
jgi:hypothetical protein